MKQKNIGVKKVEIPLAVIDSINMVLSYMWADEEASWREMENPPKGHVYNDLVRIAGWLRKNKL